MMHRDFDPAVQFFQFVEDLQRRHPGSTPVGSTQSVQGEILRFKANPSLAFPASEIASVTPNPVSEGVLDVCLNLIGLYGPASPLPTIFTERVIQAESNRTLGDFLDLFNHRFAGLLFLIWRHYRHDLRYEANAADALSRAIGSLFGLLPLGGDAAGNRNRVLLLPYTGLLALPSRSASSVGKILGAVFGLACRVEEFIPRRIALPPEARFCLGQDLELGVETILGESIEDVQGHCRIWLGPLPFGRFLDFLPDAEPRAERKALIEFVLKEPLSHDLGFVLEAGTTPTWTLGEARLGWTSWADPPADRPIEIVLA